MSRKELQIYQQYYCLFVYLNVESNFHSKKNGPIKAYNSTVHSLSNANDNGFEFLKKGIQPTI